MLETVSHVMQRGADSEKEGDKAIFAGARAAFSGGREASTSGSK